jgi:type IV pilus assembly protein PilN
MKIALNLATRPFADLGPALKRLRIGIAILAGLCILFGLGLHFFDQRAAAARAREHALDGQLASIQAERQHADSYMHLPANAQLLDQTQNLNQIFDEKAFSWTLAMEAMETVLPAGVQVSAIEPIRAKDGSITVHMRVVGPHDRAVDLIRNLERSRRFLLPRIVNESAATSNTPNQRQLGPVTASDRFDFDLFADYNPPSPEERAAKSAPKASASSASDRTGASSGARSSHARGASESVTPPSAGRTPYAVPSGSPHSAAPAYFRNPTRTPGGPQ